MKEESTHVLVFKTNIENETDKQRLKTALHSHEMIREVHVDIEDIDRVLRIVARRNQPEEIMTLVRNHGFICQELD